MNKDVHILSIDGCYDDQFMTTRALHKAGYKRITHACCGTEGMRMAAKCKPDLILLDINMPRMDGFDFILQLAKGENICPIILLSGSGEKHKGLDPIAKSDFYSRVASMIEQVISCRLDVAYVPHTIQDAQLYAQHLRVVRKPTYLPPLDMPAAHYLTAFQANHK